MTTKNRRKIFREMLNGKGIIVAPGAYDAWSAKLIEQAGFPAVYMTGYGVSASVLGKPDIGLLSFTEMTDQLRNIVAAVDVPVVADADNGYGGVLNVMRTVRAYEQTGVCAIQLEDQVTPKRCGHMEGKEIIPKEEMAAKIRAAVRAREDPDLVIIARTDARAVNGFEDALDRAKAYGEAGADVLFPEAPQSLAEMEELNKRLELPTLANMVEQGKTPLLSAAELEALGYKLAIWPVAALYTATKAILTTLEALRKTGTTQDSLHSMVPFAEFNRMISLDAVRKLEKELTYGV